MSDHAHLKVKHFDPLLGYCVCVHCARLPEFSRPNHIGVIDTVLCDAAERVRKLAESARQDGNGSALVAALADELALVIDKLATREVKP